MFRILQISDILSEFFFIITAAKICKYSNLNKSIILCVPATIIDLI